MMIDRERNQNILDQKIFEIQVTILPYILPSHLVVPWFGSVRFWGLISRTLDLTVVQVRPLGRTSDWTPRTVRNGQVRV